MNKSFLFSCLLIFNLLFFFSKSQNLDSLKRVVSVIDPKEKAKILIEIGNLYSDKFGQADSLLFYSQQAFNISKKTNDVDGQNLAFLNIAIAYQKKNYGDTSIAILNTLISTLDSNNSTLLGDVYLNQGLNYFRINDNKPALDFYLKAIIKYKKYKNKSGLAIAYARLAGLFINEKQTNVALDNAKRSASLVGAIDNVYNKIIVLSGLSGVYVQMGIKHSTYLDTSISYSKRALDLLIKHGYYSKANQICNSVSNAYYLKRDSISALEYAKNSLAFRNYLLPNEILISYLNLSDCYNRVKQNEKALLYLDSIKPILSIINDPYYWIGYYERIYAYNKDEGKLKEALYGLERFKSLQDSTYYLEKSSAINELEQKYNKSENEKKITELNTKNEIAALRVKYLIVGMLASILIILVIVFFYRQSVLKNKFKVLETEQRLNRARMNPHFFFNALASIQTLSMDGVNQSKVTSLISKFSKIMRQSLESTYDELVTIEEEISFLVSYLDIQKTRFDNKFDYEINVDKNLEQDELKIISMLLQPFLENSIEHGFKNLDYKGKLEINISRTSESIKIEVKDNGKGFSVNKEHKTYPSRATQIISDRLFILNKQHKSKATFNIVSNSGGPGISVIINLPIIY